MEDMAAQRPLAANDVADWFINRIDRSAGEVITALSVQKLVFLAQAWFLANKGRPLFADEFEAWATGPIVRSIFERFENFSYANVPAMERVRLVKGEKLELLEGVHERYGRRDATALEAIVQEPGGPWAKARGTLTPELTCETIITKDSIKKFYGEKISKIWP